MQPDKDIRCIVVDDEPLAVKLIADYVEKTPGFTLVLKTTQAMEALYAVQDGRADIIFLDIQMPDLNGIQFMKIIRNSCRVVLTTAYREYAMDGYEHDVIDYLLKPVTFDRYMLAVEKIKERLAVPQNTAPPAIAPAYIFIKTEHRIQKLDFDAIFYIEALRDYIAFHIPGKKILSLESMRKMEDLLPGDRFIRIHKSYIIHKDKIDFLERNKVIINGQYLPIGDTYKEKFLKQINIV